MMKRNPRSQQIKVISMRSAGGERISPVDHSTMASLILTTEQSEQSFYYEKEQSPSQQEYFKLLGSSRKEPNPGVLTLLFSISSLKLRP